MRRLVLFSALSFLACSGPSSSGGLTASAGPDQTVAPGAAVTLDASGSRDTSGATLSFSWAQTSGTNVTLSNPKTAKPTFTAPNISGVLVFQVIVSNGTTATGASTTVTVSAGDQPVAVINGPNSVVSGNTITLDGSASTDPDGEALSYSWAQLSPNSPNALNGIAGAQVTFTAPTVTSVTPFTILLAVADTKGNSGTAQTTINVQPGGTNTPPTANAGSAQTVNSGATVTLNGSASDTDGDTSFTYQWTQTAGPNVTLSSTTIAGPTFTAPTVSSNTTLTFSLVATDSASLSSSPSTVNITVQPGGSNTPPTANAGTAQTVTAGATVTLNGSASDTDGDTSFTYQWSQTAGPSVTLSSTTIPNPTFTAPTVSTSTVLTFSLVATDASSLSSAPSTVNVTVNPGSSGGNIKYVFVIVEENAGSGSIYNSSNAPYINGLMTKGAGYAYATQYSDVLGSTLKLSEPHYVWMEGGTNAYPDHTFSTDSDPSSSNSTSDTNHLVTQIKNSAGDSWMSYQEGLTSSGSGDCPVASDTSSPNYYAAKHDPFVFFQDVAFTGGSPDPNNAYCASHHKNFSALATDLGNPSTMKKFNFITPNLCDDMHGNSGCSNGCISTTPGNAGCVSAGDSWLQTNMPSLINFVNANQGVIFLVWDESEGNPTQAGLVIGPNVKAGGISTSVNHSSLLKSIEEIMGVPVSSRVTSATDFSSFFASGKFP